MTTVAVSVSLVLSLGLITADTTNSTSDRLSQAIQSDAVQARELRHYFESALRHATIADLRDQVVDASPSLALAAAWERVRRELPPHEPGRRMQPVDGKAIARFVGLAEGLIGAPVPDWWEDDLHLAALNNAGRAVFPGSGKSMCFEAVPRDDVILPDGRRQSHDIILLRWKTLARESDRWIAVDRDDNRCLLPEALLKSPKWLTDGVDFIIEDDHAIFIQYSMFSSPYRVYKICTVNEQVIWSVNVWSGGGLVSYEGGADTHRAVIKQSRDGKIVVFGLAGMAAYIEVFDQLTGDAWLRFSTAY